MPKRNVPITASTCYHVTKPDGKHYNVWSKTMLDKRIKEGIITDEEKVVIRRIESS